MHNLFFMTNQFKLVVEHGFRTYQLDKSPLMHYRMLLKQLFFPNLSLCQSNQSVCALLVGG